MTLKDIKNLYVTTLTGIYDSCESESIFHICTEDLCGMNRTYFILHPDTELSPRHAHLLTSSLSLLKQGIPVQHITGQAYFYGRMFRVNGDVLIPRGETEELVQWILSSHTSSPLEVLDIGCGSGAICVTLAAERKMWNVTGIDISLPATDMARDNSLRLSGDVNILRCDILDKEQREHLGMYDIIVSNPPYVRESEKSSMHANVTEHEPPTALWVSDADPLVFYREIGTFALTHLKEGGMLYFEINEALGKETVELLCGMGYRDVILSKDINGRDRMIRALL